MHVDPCPSPVISALPPRARRRVLDGGVRRTLDPGEFLLLAGDDRRRAYVVRSGVVKLTARDIHGRETILGLALSGHIVGDLAALDGLNQPLDAIAVTRADVLGVDADLLVELIAANAAAAFEFARAAVARARCTYEWACERNSRDTWARIAGRLLHLAELLGEGDSAIVEFDVPLMQGDLAHFAGMCRESASKTLKQFKSQGLIDYQNRRLRILRPDVLNRIRCAGRAGEPSRSVGEEGSRRFRSTRDT
ncbi:MAG: Crp/Fnr family transcriptional regulator [Actinomycetota bacterium]